MSLSDGRKWHMHSILCHIAINFMSYLNEEYAILWHLTRFYEIIFYPNFTRLKPTEVYVHATKGKHEHWMKRVFQWKIFSLTKEKCIDFGSFKMYKNVLNVRWFFFSNLASICFREGQAQNDIFNTAWVRCECCWLRERENERERAIDDKQEQFTYMQCSITSRMN